MAWSIVTRSGHRAGPRLSPSECARSCCRATPCSATANARVAAGRMLVRGPIGIVWSEGSFREYLENPQEKMPGTKMILSVKNEKELADLWAYLKQFGADGKKRSQ